jgi:RNA polymerase subunit RPABC4/transcription elongation factor Spt4
VLDYVGNLGRHGPINALIIGNNAASTITCRACNHKGIPKGSRKCPSCGVALKDAEIPMRTCDECYEVYPKKLAACPACGTKPARPRTTAPIGATADTNSEILADLTALEAREWLPVSRVRSQVHNKPGKPPSFKVSYTVPGHQWPVNEFFCFEHGGVTARIAEVKWRRLGGRDPAPATASEANARAPGELRVPAMVRVREERGWPAIKGYRFNDDAS